MSTIKSSFREKSSLQIYPQLRSVCLKIVSLYHCAINLLLTETGLKICMLNISVKIGNLQPLTFHLSNYILHDYQYKRKSTIKLLQSLYCSDSYY